MKKLTIVTLALSLALSLSGCMTASTYASHKDLTVNSKMSDSIFLPPVKEQDKVVYVDIKNTTTQKLDNLKSQLVKDIESKGWKVTDNIDSAMFTIQINVLQAGEAKDPTTANSAISDGFGSLAGGAAIGSAIGLAGGNYQSAGLVGLAVAGADYVGSQALQDKTYSVITDVQIGQKVDGQITETTNSNLENGSSVTTQTSSGSSNWKYYRVRVGTVADQINLTLDNAMPEIQTQLAKEISGVLS